MTDPLTPFLIFVVAIRPVHMLLRLPAARARQRAIEKFHQKT
ncbi:hypothetical protein [Alloyangia mangrovi]|nr:hypothetical protein [Alloyangia mangrovi]